MKKFIYLLLITVVFLSCKKKKDETEPVQNTCSGTMTVNVDGVSASTSGFNNTLLKENSNGQAARRMDIRVNTNGGTLVLSVSNWDFQNPPSNGVVVKAYHNDYTDMTCQDISGASYCDGMLGTFIKNNVMYMTIDESAGHITISKIDNANKTVSGSYNFTVSDFMETESMTFSGTFTDLCYTVLN